jgi:CRP/FNR family transcriptional regulator, dissimilatory nitrate respiration regulator
VNRNMKLNARDRDIVLRSALLAELEPRLQRRVLEVASLVTRRAREVIIPLESTPRNFFAVVSGHVRLYRVDAKGREADIAIYGPGDVFGECVMFLDGCYPFQVQAAEAVTLAAFDIQAISTLMVEEPAVLIAIGRIMA